MLQKSVALRAGAAATAIAGVALIMFWMTNGADNLSRLDDQSLTALLASAPGHLAGMPIERVNLLCAQGLSGDKPEREQCMATLRVWADRVRTETERHRYRFDRNPREFENSEGFFKMLMLTVVLAEDFSVHYRPGEGRDPGSARLNDGFFARPEDVFLHGLLGPGRQGTCSSMPVLYVAIGRQLGYPLKLVTTKGHLFVRWEGAGERFNVEATGHGLNRLENDYYRHWPFEITPADEAAEGYLKSLSPQEELAVSLSIRGMCLQEAGRIFEAAETFAHASRLAPSCASYREVLGHLKAKLSIKRTNLLSKGVTRL